MKKQLITYTQSKPFDGEYNREYKFVEITVRSSNIVDPAKALLDASHYKDDSLEHIQKKVQRMRQLYLKNWIDFGWCSSAITFKVQGSQFDDGFKWYAARIDSMKVNDWTVKTVGQLYKANPHFDSLDDLISTLEKIKAVEVVHDRIGDFWIKKSDIPQELKRLELEESN